MNEIEEAYLLGQQHYEILLAQHLEAAQQEELAQIASIEQSAIAEAELAQLLEHAYVSGMADHEAALAHTEAAHSALLAASAPAPSKDELDQEEAYQIGVMYAKAQALIQEIDSGSASYSAELKKTFDKGREDYHASVEQAAPENSTGRDKSTS
jgi:hypothetical protein